MNTQSGRSMVEMLGVLAIIGVLSVGAIAGYSKAMMKYKLNKQMEQIGSILDYVNIHLDDLKRSRASITGNLIPLFKKLNVIPQEMIRENRDNAIFDVFGTMILLVNYTTYGNYYFEFQLYLNKGQKESCMNLFTIAKAKREQLWRTKFRTTKGEGSPSEANSAFGDSYCTSKVKCLKDLTVAEMEDYCNVCEDKDTCRFYYQMML
jgi:type II secretory pathway pseudopilin PulG